MKRILSMLTASAFAVISLTQAASAKCTLSEALEGLLRSSCADGSCQITIGDVAKSAAGAVVNIGGKDCTLNDLLGGSCGSNTAVNVRANKIEEVLKRLADLTSGSFGKTPLPENAEKEPFSPVPDEKPEEEIPQSTLPSIQEESRPEKPQTEAHQTQTTDASQSTEMSYEDRVVELVNEQRRAYGLSEVKADNAALMSAAAVRAKEQATLFSHTRPNGSRCFTVLDEYGVTYRKAGENVAYGQSSPEEVMRAWMNSEGHRANILNASYTTIGVGFYRVGSVCYWSQLFIG